MALSRLVKGLKTELLVTPHHEAWLARTSEVELTEGVADTIRTELLAKQRDRRRTWSSSSLGYCARKHVYTYLGMPRERGVDSDLAATFIHGTWTHLKWQAMGRMAGWLGQIEVPCTIPRVNYSGTIDGILASGDAGWEFKSIRQSGFQRVLASGPEPKHLRQIHGYMLATGLRRWSLIYENKNDQAYQEFLITYDRDLAVSVLRELAQLNAHVIEQYLPPQLPGCVSRSTSEYRQCPFRDRCNEGHWPSAKLVIKRGS